jgi:hypothetical protein
MSESIQPSNHRVVRFPGRLPAPSAAALDVIMNAQSFIFSLPQIPMPTEHVLHAGLYVRTIRMLDGNVVIGSLIRLPTVVILNGPCSVLAGDGVAEYEGYNVIPGSAGRKSVFVARGDVDLTMIFATAAATIEDAENEVFAEADLLMSRNDDSLDTVVITGE